MKIIVKQATAETAKIDFKGNSFEVTRQPAIIESDDGETRSPIVLDLKKGSQPYPVGEYRLGDSSFYIDGKYKKLEFARELELIPLRAATAIHKAG